MALFYLLTNLFIVRLYGIAGFSYVFLHFNLLLYVVLVEMDEGSLVWQSFHIMASIFLWYYTETWEVCFLMVGFSVESKTILMSFVQLVHLWIERENESMKVCNVIIVMKRVSLSGSPEGLWSQWRNADLGTWPWLN